MTIISKNPVFSSPVVSIITVVYNNVEYVERAIKSVLSQRYPLIEYIIIDGGSSDGSIDIINRYQDKLHFFLSEKDNGIYDALNKGIKNSTGSVIGILHSDDVFYDDFSVTNIIENMVKKNSEFCFSDVVITNRSMNKVIRYYQSGYFKHWMLRVGIMPPHPSCFIKKALFDEFGLYSTKYLIAGDFDFMVRIFYGRSIKSSYLSQTSVKMMIGGLSNSSLSNKFISAREIYNVLKENNIFSMYVFQLLKFIIRFFEFFLRPREKS